MIVGQFRAPLEQTRMQIEDVTGIGLAARRTTEQQRDGPVGIRLLRQVVEHDQYVVALIHPVLTDRGTGVRREVLESGRVGCRGGHDRGVLERTGFLELLAHARDGRGLLSGGDVDAADLLLRVAGAPVLHLVQDGVHGDRRLSGLPVTDDQLALTAADGGHGIDRLDTGLQWLVDLLPVDHRWRLQLQRTRGFGVDLAQPVQGLAERIHGAAEEGIPHRDGKDLTGAPDRLALLDATEVTQDDDADLADLEVQRQSERPVLELDQLIGHGRVQSFDVRDPVASVHHSADLFPRGLRRVGLRVTLYRLPDVLRPDRQLRHGSSPLLSLMVLLSVPRLVHRVAVVSDVHRTTDLCDAMRNTAVDDFVLHGHANTTEDLRADLKLKVDLPAVDPCQRFRQPLLLRVGAPCSHLRHREQPLTPTRSLLHQRIQRLFQPTTTQVPDNVPNELDRLRSRPVLQQLTDQTDPSVDIHGVVGQR